MNYTSLEEIKTWLRQNLSEERYLHSLGTAECAKALAEKYNLDENKAYFAGLVHDCAKCLSKEKTENILQQLDVEEGELCNPKTHHAPVGAFVAKQELQIDDEEVLSAIRWHTLGKINMSDFEKIIFLADKIEEKTRPCDLYEPIKNVLKEEDGLNKAILMCYKNTIKSLVDRNLKICKTTIDIYNSLL